MLGKGLDEIVIADLEQLVADGVHEGKTVEFKRDVYRLDAPDPKERVKQQEEMLKDIAPFANTLGGDLIIGIKETDAVASEVCNIDARSGADGLRRRICDIVQKWTEPRIALGIRAVPRGPNRVVLIIRVTRSPIGPHRVVYGGEFGQFWARHSSGTYRMDTDDLRRAFNSSASAAEKLAEQ